MNMMRMMKQWKDDTAAMAAVEVALIIPVLLIMLLGTFDMGYGILAAQKTVRAAQVTADLISRNRNVDDAIVDEAVEGGRLALTPFNPLSYGVDIKSIAFDDEGNTVQLWCDTRNMAANNDALDNIGALAEAGEGIVVVTARYDYQPAFAGFIFDTFRFSEVAFARGRLTPTVTHSNGQGC